MRDATPTGTPGSPRSRWAWTHRHGKALLVASVVAVVLSGSSLVAALLGLDNDPSDPVDPAECLVGRWRTVEHEQVLSADIGRYVQADRDGPVTEYRDDGTGVTDYGEGVRYEIVDTPAGIGDTEVTVSGSVSYDYVAQDGTLQYRNIESDLVQSSQIVGDLPTSLSAESFDFRCQGDTLTFHRAGDYDARLARLGS